MAHMNIGDAAAAAGVTPKMIRHYEALGMIPDVQRTDSGYRLYSPREVAMLRFIRQARSLGFPVKQVEQLLVLWRDEGRSSREVKAIAQQQLAELEERQREIDEMRGMLSDLVSQCQGDDAPHCAILDNLSAPAGDAAGDRDSRKNLKRVKAGSTATARHACHGVAPETPAHSGLTAWSRSLVR